MDTILLYNQAWEQKKITTPLVVLIGGYAGTGKSTLGKEIVNLVPNLNNFPTGIIRATLRDYITIQDNPYLYHHTYDLHEMGGDVKEHFLEQCKPIIGAINQSIDFANSEKQMILFDGNHILPGMMNPKKHKNVVEIYLKVSDPTIHREMLSGPTHNRDIAEKQFETARILHEYIVQEAEKFKKPLFEFNQWQDGVLQLIEDTTKGILSS